MSEISCRLSEQTTENQQLKTFKIMIRKFLNIKFRGLIFLSLLFTVFSVQAQQENADVRTGNRLYADEQFLDAEIAFRRALETNPQSFEASFNLGNALVRQEKYEEAFRQYRHALALLPQDDAERRAAAFHNIGNTLLMSGQIAQSIEAFKESLRNNPRDNETRYNLAFAQKLLQNQEQNEGGGQNQEQQQEREQQQEDQNQQQNQPEPHDPIMSQENAQQILNALLEDERRTQENVRRPRPRGSRNVEKDW